MEGEEGSAAAGEQEQEMQRHVSSRICRFGGCCTAGLNCPWWHSDEEIKIFEDERELKRRKLAVRCGFCARGECRHGAACQRTQRAVAAGGGEELMSVGLRDEASEDASGFASQTEVMSECCSDCNYFGSEGSDTECSVEREATIGTRCDAFEERRVGVARRRLVLAEPDGIGDAGRFGVLAVE